MNPERLINPFIIYWDIDPFTAERGMVKRVCDDLVRAKIFVIHLRDSSPGPSVATAEVVERLRNENTSIIVTVRGTFFERAGIDIFAGAGIRRLYVEVSSLQQFSSTIDSIKRRIDHGEPTGISVVMTKESFRQIPAIIAECHGSSIREIEFPIPGSDGTEIYCPGPDDITWLSKEIQTLPLKKLNLSIHDPFLWKLFHQKENPNEEGCNGAKTMMYISGTFEVTPCPILPVSLGNLREMSLEEIFLSEQRQQIRKDLSRSPEDCGGCSIVETCRGGCRGRAYVLSHSFKRKDPACLSPS